MRKSGKKIKSDRINTLRKKYDAFLEDDKKRKDRNEFILRRLEEMRSTSALVQIRHKDNGHLNENIYTSRRVPRLEDNLRTFKSSANIPINYSLQRFDTSILKEISKSFILIPKLQPNISNSVTYLNPLTEKPDMIKNEETDWKSKYDILNELKKSEKEGNSENVNVIYKESNKPFVSSSEPLLKQERQIHEDKTPSDSLHNYNTSIDDTQTGKQNSISVENDTNPTNTSRDFNANGKEDDIDDKTENKICSKPTVLSTELNKNNQYATYVDNIHELESSRQKFPEHKPKIITNMEVHNNVANNDAPQDFINAEYTNKVDNESEYKEKSDQDKCNNEIMQHHKSNDFSEKSVREKGIRIKEEIQEDIKGDIVIVSNENNLQNYETNEAPVIIEQNANAEVSELKNEQNEMFYAENPENKYNYDEHNMENLQYPEENQNYTDEQYSYHDESQQEQTYTAEINEHEESTERYDPNFKQQYTGNYENVIDVPQYENQQYEVDNSYEIQQNVVTANVNYDEVLQNNENIELVPSEDLYQNPEENLYNYSNENYESQQYATNEQQEYVTTDTNVQDQYAVEQEYVGIHTEQDTSEHTEKVPDLENGFVDNENTILTNNKESPIVPDVSLDKTESSEVS
ncbi:SUN domain-containing protein 2-like [Melitaea cinxia]|uniref:SUN domain-containing protein 2-like n=1 Tax=Melitaea cinxia TaxID=113334 RepID=UPI001E274444|nr:SUN domain-containing protein 2-like [Melitaea cinxia]